MYKNNPPDGNRAEYGALLMSVLGIGSKPIASGRWITVKRASEVTGHSDGRLRVIADEGRIKASFVNRRWYLFEGDVQKLKVPGGYWDLEAASKYSGLCREQIKRLRRQGNVKGIIRHNEVFVEASDFKEYIDPPEGYFTRGDAKAFAGSVTEKPIERLVSAGLVRTKEKRGRKYYNKKDLWDYFQIPDDYMPIVQAAREFHYCLRWIEDVIRTNGFPTKRIGKSTYVSRTLLYKYFKNIEGGNENMMNPNLSISGTNNGTSLENSIDFADPSRDGSKKEICLEVILDAYDKEAPHHDSPENLIAAIAKRLKGNQRAGGGVAVELVAEVVASFN